MGMCGESCAEKFSFSRADQDAYAIESYKRAAEAWAAVSARLESFFVLFFKVAELIFCLVKCRANSQKRWFQLKLLAAEETRLQSPLMRNSPTSTLIRLLPSDQLSRSRLFSTACTRARSVDNGISL